MFRDHIQKVVDAVEGGVAGILMGYDGIAVESYTRPPSPLDIQTVGMEFSHVISQVRKAVEMLEIGGLREITIRSDKLSVIVHVLTDEYFLACAVAPEGNLARARYLVRLAVPRVQAEL